MADETPANVQADRAFGLLSNTLARKVPHQLVLAQQAWRHMRQLRARR